MYSENNEWEFDKKQKFQGDKADERVERTTTPKKKPRKKEMLPEIKEENQEKAKKIIFVEHDLKINQNLWSC
ncbi:MULTISPECIES: hypothetical protein [unclassified Okeania]|uniref:hypothetical protein n=1 Tax=unclassified Okeania TaxID=2634635 RepID=UPI002579BF0D|nr:MULTISPECIES: hypothetical protein [unclassified Okeania]